MTRFGPAFAILLAAVGCGPALVSTDRGPLGSPREAMSHAASVRDGLESASALPDCARVAEATLGFSRIGGGRGYFWVGYTASDVGQQELNTIGSGDGFSFGTGFKLSDAGHTFVEFAYERSLKHSFHPNDVVFSDTDTVAEQGIHERTLIGLRTATAARAREETQPRPYISYGIGYNNVSVNYQDLGGAAQSYFVNGLGLYVGLGCEFPSEGRGSFGFDAKFHTWEDTKETPGTYGSLAYSLLWINRF